MTTSKLVWISISFVLTSWIGTIILVPYYYNPPDNSGAFGDMFGSINALFSGLAFVGVVVAILLQKDELGLQRQELEETRDELKGQKVQLEEQNKTFKKQSFEDTFFQLLTLYSNIVNAIDLDSGDGYFEQNNGQQLIKGRDCFVRMYNILNGWLEAKMKQGSQTLSDDEKRDLITGEYAEFYNRYDSDLGHYFRTLYNLIKYIDSSNVPCKKFYTDLVRAQLSSHELLLVYYNCISDLGRTKLAPLVTKYNLLKHLPKDKLLPNLILSI